MKTENRKIKILVDAHIFDHSFQGTATYILGIYSELVRNEGFEITICAHDVDKVSNLFSDTRFRFVQAPHSHRLKRLTVDYPKLIRDGGYDYAHFQYVVPFVKDTKFINTIHDLLFLDFTTFFPWTYRISRKLLFGYSARRSDIILSVSNYSKKRISALFNIPQSSIHVTANAADTKPRSEINIAEKYGVSKFILFVSRFEPRKNHIGLLRAFISQNLADQGYHLVFIGSKKEKIEFQSYTEVLDLVGNSLKDNVHFYEGLSVDDLNAFYQQAECFVFPSFAEGFGIPPIEAALNNCKVLCSNQTAMADFDFFKYRFDPYNQNEFATMLSSILEDDEYPYEQINDEIVKQFNWKKIADDFADIVQKDFNKNTNYKPANQLVS